MKNIVTLTALLMTSPIQAETIAISGFPPLVGISPGICSIVPTDTCSNYVFVAGIAERLCQERPKKIQIIGHSMGGSGAIDLLHRLEECGVAVSHVVVLDPQVHPYDIPSRTKLLPIYSFVMAGNGEGHSNSVNVGGEHIGMALRPDIRTRIREFLRN